MGDPSEEINDSREGWKQRALVAARLAEDRCIPSSWGERFAPGGRSSVTLGVRETLESWLPLAARRGCGSGQAATPQTVVAWRRSAFFRPALAPWKSPLAAASRL